MNLAGRTALVTGGAVRIGSILCKTLASHGCNVIIHCDRSIDEARGLATGLKKQGVRAWAIRAHFAEEAACKKLIRKAVALTGSLHVLVNNAAVFHRQSLREAGTAAWRNEMAVNFFAPVLLTRYFAEAPGAAAIVNILDHRVAALDTGAAPYSVAKKALEYFTRLAAVELAPDIRVNAVAPGPALPRSPGSTRAAREPAGTAPLARRPTPEDVAEAMLFLIGNDAVTGQTVFVDGGRHLGKKHA